VLAVELRKEKVLLDAELEVGAAGRVLDHVPTVVALGANDKIGPMDWKRTQHG